MKYSFHPYHKYFTKRAIDEIQTLQKILPNAKFEHFGSTAIQGVGGKGIIDIYCIVDKKDLEEASKIVQGKDYEFKTTGGVVGERLFHQRIHRYKDGHKQMFHLHITYKESENLKETLNFRDILRKNKGLAKEYSDIKHLAVREAKKYRNKKDKKEAYMATKRPIIEKILKLIKESE